MTRAPRCGIRGEVHSTGDPIGKGGEQPIRVVLADDHADFRRGLAEMLSTGVDIEVIGEAENGAVAVELAREALPDVVVLDLAMPVVGGREALELLLREISPPPGVVILSMHDRPRLVRELLEMGANAFLAKSASLTEIIAAVKRSRPKSPPREGSGEVPPAT
jgi:DNA-binding NarL/FixJ family response regulator